ncbi:EF-hand domain-containing protein [Streptomyces sp. WELS2]|uniref:EF-hand domain-containing protein n=1 Tax=Streptomyces sp. WELS2 TaxID=2749435 RepID=UPI0015EFFAF9|nr:EF-hand domain-containing protein [Streptomyces sp. WELS2]
MADSKREQFDANDTDHDGYITATELKPSLKGNGHIGEEHIATIVRMADVTATTESTRRVQPIRPLTRRCHLRSSSACFPRQAEEHSVHAVPLPDGQQLSTQERGSSGSFLGGD